MSRKLIICIAFAVCLWTFIAGLDVQRWYLTKNCPGGNWVIGQAGGIAGGGCLKLPQGALYKIERISR